MKTTINKTDSEAIAIAEFNDGNMTIKFRGGKRYNYKNVPVNTFTEFVNAPSLGKFFSTHIRGKFAYQLA